MGHLKNDSKLSKKVNWYYDCKIVRRFGATVVGEYFELEYETMTRHERFMKDCVEYNMI